MRPIKSGDKCFVIGGLGRHKSPNIGLTVTVGKYIGDHSQHGRIWACSGVGIKQMSDAGEYVTTGQADFAQGWLQLADAPPSKNTTTESELSHG